MMCRCWLFVLAVGIFVASTVGAATGDSYYYGKVSGKNYILTPRSDEFAIRYDESANVTSMENVAGIFGLEPVHPADERLHFGVYTPSHSMVTDDLLGRIGKHPLVEGVGYAYVDQEGYTKYPVPGTFAVRFVAEIGEERMIEIIADYGCEVAYKQWTPGFYRLRAPKGRSIFEMIREFVALDEVLFAEPSCVSYNDLVFTPNDYYFGDQWSLRNTGQIGSCPCPDADIDADDAWDLERGDPDVIVVIIDTGMDTDHPDLAGNLLPRGDEDWDFSDDPSKVPEDNSGHGTCCSGIAAAVTNNSTGVAGIANQCRIMPLKVDLASGHNENRADAILYASSRRPEFKGLVMSNSWRMSSGDFECVRLAIIEAEANDCVICFAAGNYGVIEYPAKYEQTIAVGGTSPCDEHKDDYSCDGEYYWEAGIGDELDVVAPCVLIPTTDIGGSGGYSSGDYYMSFNGTSSACPHVAGVCALIWSADPSLDNDGVRSVLESTADDQVGRPSEDVEGWDPYHGWGRINVYDAVSSLVSQVTVDLTPDATIVKQGEKLGYTVAVTNGSGSSVNLSYWTDIIMWTGEPYKGNPVFGPKNGTLLPGQTKQGHIGHKVPNNAPLKTYTCCGRIGFHPDDVWDEDCFQFTVVAGSTGGAGDGGWEVVEDTMF
jgi:subtilisin family serine protease